MLASRVPKKCAEGRQRIAVVIAGQQAGQGVPGNSTFIPTIITKQIKLKASGRDFVEVGIGFKGAIIILFELTKLMNPNDCRYQIQCLLFFFI